MNVAERAPDAVGEKVIDTLQLAPAASVRPEQPSLTCVKSSGFAPRVAALLMNSDALPVFVTVMDCGALVVPIACSAKVSEAGENVTAGAPAGGGGVPPLHRCRDRRRPVLAVRAPPVRRRRRIRAESTSQPP